MVIIIMANQNIFQRIGNMFRRTEKDSSLEDKLKQQLEQNERKQKQKELTLLYSSINRYLEKMSNINVQYDYSRLHRYMDIDIIIEKIPEQNRQLTIINDLTLSPEWNNLSSNHFLTINIDDISDTLDDDEMTEFSKSLRKFISDDKIETSILKQIFDVQKYGDGYIYIQPVVNGDKMTKILLQNIPPHRVIDLNVGNNNFGYLITPNPLRLTSNQEQKFVLAFLSLLQQEISPKDIQKLSEDIQMMRGHKITESQDILKDIKPFFDEGIDEEDNDITDESKEVDITDIINEIMANPNIEQKFSTIIENVLMKDGSVINTQKLKKGKSGYLKSLKRKLSEAYRIQSEFDVPVSYTPGSQINQKWSTDMSQRMSSIMGQDVLIDSELEKYFDQMGFDFFAVDDDYSKILYVPPMNMQHFVLTSNYQYFPYGTSLFDSVRSIQGSIIILEYSMVIYRLLKAPERRKFTVDISGMDENEIPEYIQSIISKMKTSYEIDKQGNVSEQLNQITRLEDFLVLVKDGIQLLDVTTLPGGTLQQQIDDIEYLHKKLISALGLPPSYFGFEDGTSGVATVLTIQDNRVQKTITRIQKDVNRGLQSLFTKIFFWASYYDHQVLDSDVLTPFQIYDLLDTHNLEITLPPLTSLSSKIKLETLPEKVTMIEQLHNLTNYNIEDLLQYFAVFNSEDISKFKSNMEPEEEAEPDLEEEPEYTNPKYRSNTYPKNHNTNMNYNPEMGYEGETEYEEEMEDTSEYTEEEPSSNETEY